MMFLFIRNRNSSSADDLRKIYILKENMLKNYVVPVSIKPVVWFPLPGCVALSAWLVMLNTCLWLLLPMIWHSSTTQWVQGSAWCLISTNWTIIDSAAAAATSILVSHCLVSHIYTESHQWGAAGNYEPELVSCDDEAEKFPRLHIVVPAAGPSVWYLLHQRCGARAGGGETWRWGESEVRDQQSLRVVHLHQSSEENLRLWVEICRG